MGLHCNLARADEECLDHDLVEAVVAHIDEIGEHGAILVFRPGECVMETACSARRRPTQTIHYSLFSLHQHALRTVSCPGAWFPLLFNYFGWAETRDCLLCIAGMGEISALLERLSSSRRFARGSHWLLPLHSTISPQEQRRAFEVPPPGVRKIVIVSVPNTWGITWNILLILVVALCYLDEEVERRAWAGMDVLDAHAHERATTSDAYRCRNRQAVISAAPTLA